MVAYRFCRPDDIPLLVRAVNECYLVHHPELSPLTVDAFRREMKELDVWPSNSMVALADGDAEPLAVLIGTKRPDEVLVHRLGTRPGHLRRGHARHLVTSLSQKLAVLGPERLVAEVPADDPVVNAFFTAVGWSREAELVDRRRAMPRGSEQPIPEDLVIPVTVAELEGAGALGENPDAAWGRRLATLRARADHLVGAAVATPDQVEAYVIAEPPGEGSVEPLDVLAAGCRDPLRADFLLGLLFRWLSHTARRPLRIPRLAPGELPAEVLGAAGFERDKVWRRYAGEARPL